MPNVFSRMISTSPEIKGLFPETIEKLIQAFPDHLSRNKQAWADRFEAFLSSEGIVEGALREGYAQDLLTLKADATQAEHGHSSTPELSVALAKKWYPAAENAHSFTRERAANVRRGWHSAGK